MSTPTVNPYITMRHGERHASIQGEPLLDPTAANLVIATTIVLLAVWLAMRITFRQEQRELHERHRTR